MYYPGRVAPQARITAILRSTWPASGYRPAGPAGTLPRKHLISLGFESNAAVDIQNQVIESAPNAPMSTKDRYDVIMEPTDTWTVWDLVNDEPAMFGDHVLAALTQVEAMAARDVMNDAWRRLQEGALQRHMDAA